MSHALAISLATESLPCGCLRRRNGVNQNQPQSLQKEGERKERKKGTVTEWGLGRLGAGLKTLRQWTETQKDYLSVF